MAWSGGLVHGVKWSGEYNSSRLASEHFGLSGRIGDQVALDLGDRCMHTKGERDDAVYRRDGGRAYQIEAGVHQATGKCRRPSKSVFKTKRAATQAMREAMRALEPRPTQRRETSFSLPARPPTSGSPDVERRCGRPHSLYKDAPRVLSLPVWRYGSTS